MKKNLTLLLYILKYLGFGWLVYRIWYYLKIKSGILQYQTKPGSWEQYSLENILSRPRNVNTENYKEHRLKNFPGFFFTQTDKDSYRSYLLRWDDAGLFNSVKDLKSGYFRLFSHLKLHTGFPPDWHKNYTSTNRYPQNAHWSTIGDFDGGDIKVVWELSRFGFVYDLVRAYWITNDEKYPDLFWKLVEDWRANNLPNNGVNWKCGQETTFRVMAWCWGLYGFFDSSYSTPERVDKLKKMIYFSGIRIERNIGYALSQKNNHGISEAVGLWTIGVLFPEFKNAKRCRQKGKRLIEKLTLELFNEEGAFTQNSVNYHRLALHDLIWAIRLGELNGEHFSEQVKEKFRKATEFLYQLQDEKTGQLPSYGANDGALILPLSNCNYRDYRPVLQSSFYLVDRKRIYTEGPWDEDLLWLFGPESMNAPVIKKKKYNLQLKKTGYYTLRTKNGFLFTRCGKHIYRPGQGDMLHVDIWWNGYNIAIDPGSYSYNAPPPWDKGPGMTRYHNTVTVDDLDQMDSYGRFLSFPWVKGKVFQDQVNDEEEFRYFEGTHDGYHRLNDPVQYRRGILRCNEDYWIIIDKLWGEIPHRYRLHWLFLNLQHHWDDTDRRLILYPGGKEYQIHYGSLNENIEASLISADEQSPRGWLSPYYYYKEPALSLEIVTKASSAVFYTVLGPGVITVKKHVNLLSVSTENREITIELSPDPHGESSIVNVKRIGIPASVS